MSREYTPFFVRILIITSMAFLLGLLVKPQTVFSKPETVSAPAGTGEAVERITHPAGSERRAEPIKKVFVIKPGNHLSGILEKQGISKKDALYISKKAGKVFSLNRMRPGSELELYFSPDGSGLQEVNYKVSRMKRLVLYNGRVIACASKPAGHTNRPSTDWSAAAPAVPAPEAKEAPEAPETTAPESAYSISLVSSYDPGTLRGTPHHFQDPYGLLAEGKVLAPVIPSWDSPIRPDKVRKQSAHSRSTAKKRPDGGFLKAPLAYRYISSGYTGRRIHPITNTAQPHYGIDYAAPKGTPVHAIGSGKVIFVGWDGGFGKTIRIRHKSGYISHYGHLSRYAKDIKVGRKVSRGTIIGHVGMTGLATGPHLDFRVTHHGRFINPAHLDRHYKRVSGRDAGKTRG